ncbi:MAG: carbamate kinase [Methanomassiliicoccales archaeon]
MESALIALGGNAIRKAGEKGNFDMQLENTNGAAVVIAELAERGYKLAVTHGNGPQVGDILLQNEIASQTIPPLPLDACVAESQGLIGYMLVDSIDNEFRRRGIEAQALCMLTRTIVREEDSAFRNPSKPVGEYYTEERSMRLKKELGWHMVFDQARGGYRRVVPSPEPAGIVEGELLKTLFRTQANRQNILIVSGGGGIPVVKKGDGYRGVEAVIDKDLAAQVVATLLGVDHLFILTDVDAVYLDFGTERQRKLIHGGTAEMRKLINAGQFGAGSMLPKVEAAVRFVESGGKSSIITSQEKLFDALDGRDGTTITTD